MLNWLVKVIKFLLYVTLAIWLFNWPIGDTVITWISWFYTDFYDNVLIYSNFSIYVIFCCFCLFVGYAIISS